MSNIDSYLSVINNFTYDVFFKFNVAKGNFKNSLFTIIVFLCCVLGISFIWGGAILNFFETVLNLYFFEYSISDKIIVTTVFLLLVIVYLLLKSSYELIFNILNSKRILLGLKSVSTFTFTFSFLSMLIVIFVGVQKVEHSKIDYAVDILTVNNIESVLSANDIQHTTYVSKIPYLFKQAKFKIENQHLELFENIVFKVDEQHLAITTAAHPYYLLINQNYKYLKVSDKTGIYVREPSIIRVLEQNGYKFSEFYYKENLDLKKLSRRIKINYVQDQGLLLNNEKQITRNPDKTYLLKGKYKFTIFFGVDTLNNLSNEAIGSFNLTASDQEILLYRKELKKVNFKDKLYKLEFNLALDTNFHGVEFLVKDIHASNQFYLKSIEIDKLPTND